MTRTALAAAALTLSLSVSPLAAAAEFGVLFEADGVETTYNNCAACHSERLVAQQGMTRARWDKMLDWMIEEQGMWELEPDDRTVILDYLAEHYNTDRPNFPR
ncbi:MAG: aldehyde dehydrogenase [Pseudomonadota bacterium]